MAHWNSTDLNWKIFNDVNQRRANASASRNSTPSPTTSTVSTSSSSTAAAATTTTPSSRLRGPQSTPGSRTTSKSLRRTTPPILSAFESTSRPWHVKSEIQNGIPESGTRGRGGGTFTSSPRPMQRGRLRNAVATTVAPIVATSTALLPSVFYGHQQANQSSNANAKKLDVITSPSATTRSLSVDKSNRTLYNHYVDTFSNVTTTTAGSVSPSSILSHQHRNASEMAARSSRTNTFAIASSLANFTTSESSEVLFDTDNGSRNSGGGELSDKDDERSFRGGSNFMVVLEDFGEYFYNFNATNGVPGGVGGGLNFVGSAYGNLSGDYNSSSNCSLTNSNSTCGAVGESKLWAKWSF